uniref:Protein O-mannose kinase n=1 Tax=Graphocephala atropunctata TaxID=36148 RepID=A0A1B6LZ61_9HEMI
MEVVIITILFLWFQCIRSEQECPVDQFKLRGMESCRPLIVCEDLHDIQIIKRLGSGAVKDVFLIDWKGFSLVLSVPINFTLLEDFMEGAKVLKLLNPSKHVVQFLGYCNKSHTLLTKYYPMGNAANFFSKILPYSALQGIEFCYQYALVLNHLHNGPAGRRVFCDSNSLDKLLSQLLVTSDQSLVLNDVDALPELVNGTGIKCGHRRLEGSFVAPEQLWNRNDPFKANLMPSYNEKTDIWKAASVCDYFLNKAKDGVLARYRLYELHLKCKDQEPLLRPTAQELLSEYSKVAEEYRIHSEL